jgi:AraC-like DNA-binding protein
MRVTGADFTAAAYAAGYFDQSHFINDFRRATGSPPDAFFRQAAAE